MEISPVNRYMKIRNEFPLIKLLEARADLSIQVHPDNKLEKNAHAYGKLNVVHSSK
jgi:mannose-6-phosphate isomerase class I